MFYRPWQTVRPDPARSAALSAALGMPRLVCDVMCARGLDTPEAARAVCGGGDALSDPMLLSGMEAAVARIHRAIDDGERIAVFGDYDVDGVTATALLYTYLDSAGADVYYKLPSRDDDGYGLSETAVDLMAAKGVSLIVTVDNGVSANAAIAHAKEQGVDVVVTDHHLPPQTLPEAAAIVNPQLPGDESPCKTLSGAGVAFKLAAALDGCTPDEMLPFYGDLAAIGTIADIMLLEGENRRIVKAGLALLQQTERPGIAALIEACGLGGKELTAENVSFGLAPRLNAAGRMDSAAAALELLLCEDPEEAEAIVAGLEAQNAARQKAEQDILQGVLDSVAADETYGADRILVVWGRGYHQGVIGIVCSRLCDRYGCPVVLISVDEDGVGKGSGRSIGSFNLFEALTSCEDLFERYGGHALAAGLTVQADRIEELRTRLRKYAETHVTMAELVPQLHIDCMVQSEWLTQENIESLSVLEPYGMKNAEPVFCMKNMTVEEITPLSSDRHVRLSLIKDGKRFSAIWFGIGAGGLGFVEGNTVDAAFHLEINEFRGRRSVQLTICDVQLSDCEHLADQKILNLYNTLMQDGPLTAREARLLLPDRKDLVAVWRHVTCRAEDGRLSVPDGALSRRVAWESRRDINIGKLFVCLDVFQESGLISYHFKEGMLNILLKPYEGKADISGSVVLATLQSMAG